MKPTNRYLITAALPYANGPLHIGHLAGAYLPADIYTRHRKLLGNDIVFVCGSDEHGAAITIRASIENKSPLEIVNFYHTQFEKTFNEIGINFDIFHRTSSKLHHKTSQEFFLDLYKKEKFIEKETEQYFDEKANQFLADRYIKGVCPNCSYQEAYGDQCENCGTSLSPEELISPVSVISNTVPKLRKTRHWYLPLDQHESWLNNWLLNGDYNGNNTHDPSEWKSHVLGQCKSWLDTGLKPRSMTRDLDWGVDVPREIDGHQGKKLYVWLDAPIGYISATKQWAKEKNKNWEDYWKKEDSQLIHFIGKDNIVFHSIIFPVILQAKGEYILPFNVPANQFMNLEGSKISTSKNWAIWVHEYLEKFPNYKDELRFALIKNMPEQKDSEFTWNGFQDVVNNELVNNLSNFVNRVLVLTKKYYNGVVPKFDADIMISGPEDMDEMCFHDSELLRLHDLVQVAGENIRSFKFREALNDVMKISSFGNQILQNNEPWKNLKKHPEVVKVVINLVLQYVTSLSVILWPFLPFCAERLRNMLGITKINTQGEWLELCDNLALGNHLIEAGKQINQIDYLFTKISDDWIAERKIELQNSKKSMDNVKTAINPLNKKMIDFVDFTKLDIRCATIMHAEKIKKTNKLLKIELDVGFEKRTVVSGISEHYKAEDIIGKQVVLIANLAPRKIKGVESKGMILMGENSDGKLAFISPPKGWTNGSVVK